MILSSWLMDSSSGRGLGLESCAGGVADGFLLLPLKSKVGFAPSLDWRDSLLAVFGS